jgi:AraC-like DNA-binding protein
MNEQILREITPLTQSDCFTLFTRVNKKFDFPLHYHEEYELNFILNAEGAKRIVGDSIEVTEEAELVLVGPNVTHGWFEHKSKSANIYEITIQWHKDFLDDKFLRRNQMNFIQNMFDRSVKGIFFSKETTKAITPRLIALSKKNGFDSVMELFSILHDLSISRNMRSLSNVSPNNEQFNFNSRRVEKAFEYMNANFDKRVTLVEVAKLVNMTEVAFSRFFKKRTGYTFIDSLNDIRLGHASRKLIDSTHSIAEICYDCGFNNMSNFNRIFKKKKNATPKEFRESYAGGAKIFI